MRILLSGYFGFSNAGDEAILAALIEGIKERLPEAEIVVLSADPEITSREYEVEAVDRFSYLQIIYSLKNSSLLVSGGGSLLQDVTGRRTIPYYLSVIFLAKVLKVPVFCCAQGIGPIQSDFNRRLVKWGLSLADEITVRDRKSKELLASLGLSEVRVTADQAFTLTSVRDREVANLLMREVKSLTAPLLGVSIRSWGADEYLKELAPTLDKLADRLKAKLLLLPFHYPEDYRLSKELKSYLKEEAYLLDGDYSPRQLLGLVGKLDLLVGVRLHSLIFAAYQQVVPAGISYDPKVDNFLAQLDLSPVGYVDNLRSRNLFQEIISLWKKRRTIRNKCEKKSEQWSKLAKSNLETIEGFYKSVENKK